MLESFRFVSFVSIRVAAQLAKKKDFDLAASAVSQFQCNWALQGKKRNPGPSVRAAAQAQNLIIAAAAFELAVLFHFALGDP